MKHYRTEVAAAGFALALMIMATANAAPPGQVSETALAKTSYNEVRFSFGGGVTSAAKQVGEEDDGVASLNVAFTNRDDSRVLGANVSFQTTLFGPTHAYVGGLAGFAIGGDNAHLELTGEGGLHMVSGMGNDLFDTPATSDSEAAIPYVGAQVRAVFDVGATNAWQLELTVQGRSDLTRERRTVAVSSCFLGCSTEMQEWQLGGVSTTALAGLSYQFD